MVAVAIVEVPLFEVLKTVVVAFQLKPADGAEIPFMVRALVDTFADIFGTASVSVELVNVKVEVAANWPPSLYWTWVCAPATFEAVAAITPVPEIVMPEPAW